MKKTSLFGLLALASTFTLTSCDLFPWMEDGSEETMKFPTWKGFMLDKTTIPAGDTLRIHADLNQAGKNLYKVQYKWTMVIDTLNDKGMPVPDTLTYRIQSSASRPIYLNDEPKATFVIPANAQKGTKARNFTFTCNYEHAAAGVPQSQDDTKPFAGYLGGDFKYMILSQLYSRTENKFSTTITIE